MSVLRKILGQISALEILEVPINSKNKIKMERGHLLKLARSFPEIRIYGVNTLTGHRDSSQIIKGNGANISREIIRSHKIGIEPFFDQNQVISIGYVKAHSLIRGGTGVSPELLNQVVNTIANPMFAPKLPKRSSYSSGDVIPGAHWADELISFCKYDLQTGDALALINGNFIHLGYALSMLQKIENIGSLFIESSKLLNQKIGLSAINFYNHLEHSDNKFVLLIKYLQEGLPDEVGNKIQVPVSIRAQGNQLESFYFTLKEFCQEIETLLSKKSGNPLFDLKIHSSISQASFLAHMLSLRTNSLNDSLCALMANMYHRNSYLLSGKVHGIPIDGAYDSASLGLIQYPKAMAALVERHMSMAAPRLPSYLASTSYGVENFWTMGVNNIEKLEQAANVMVELLVMELFILGYLERSPDNSEPAFPEAQKILFEKTANIEDLRKYVEKLVNLKHSRSLFKFY